MRYPRWQELSLESKFKVVSSFVLTSDRNESDKLEPKVEDVADHYYDNIERFYSFSVKADFLSSIENE